MKILSSTIPLFLALCLFTHETAAEPGSRIKPYIMLTNTSGDAKVEATDSDLDISGGNPFEKSMAGVDLDLRGGGFSLLSQVSYTALEDTSPEIPALTFDDALTKFEAVFWTETIGITLLSGDESYFDITAGGRLTSIDSRITTRGPGGESSLTDKNTWVDPVAGFYALISLGDNYAFHLGGDYGGFDVSSKSTWQALAALDLALTDKAAFSVGYRAFGTEYEKDDFLFDAVIHGPTLGLDIDF